jgi:hypothetical protein
MARSTGFTRGIIAATAVLILILGVAPDLAVRAVRGASPRLAVSATGVAAPSPTTAR